MAYSSRGGRLRPFRGRPRRGGKQTAPARDRFNTSRIQEKEDVGNNDASDEGISDEHTPVQTSDEDSSLSEDETTRTNSYSALLQSLKSRNAEAGSPRKKRRLDKNLNGSNDSSESIVNGNTSKKISSKLREESPTTALHEFPEETAAPGEEEIVAATDESDDEDRPLHDPFESHYASVNEVDLERIGSNKTSQAWKTHMTTQINDIRKLRLSKSSEVSNPITFSEVSGLGLKQRLRGVGIALNKNLSSEDQDLFGAVFGYQDVLNACRTTKRSIAYREICALHALNHVFKTRDHVLKNNAKLRQQTNSEDLDYRDQGFTRPKVLIMVPTKQACVKFVESIVKFSQPEQQENKSRFLETYSTPDEDEWENKPEDFRELFGGNHDEDFRIGLKFTRKTIKIFSGFYNSDIIIGSPLGLMRTITTGGGAKDKKKVHDADFLSSIEVVMVDNASALQMQNWQHMEYVFSQLNQLPKDSHGCDFSRVRSWYLDGHAKYLRQTIILSSYLTPEINALANTHLHNLSGMIKYVPDYHGAMLEVSSTFTHPIAQTFLRFDSSSPLTDHDTRFKYFTTTILPPLMRDAKHHQTGILLYIPTYLDFVRLRNYLSTSAETSSLSFGSVSEYTPPKDTARARSHFISGRHKVLLYSERAHHHFRYRIQGVKKLLFYGVPDNPKFWSEVVGFLAIEDEKVGNREDNQRRGKGAVRAMFSKWDIMKLERIVGTERVGRLVNEKGGDIFDFI